MSDVPMDVDVETVNILVVGECGDGKSTLVNALRDPTKSQQAMCGKNAQGVTKDIVLYPCPDLSVGKALNILDTPGVGDHHVPPTALISMIEEILKAGMVPGGVRGVVVTTPIPDGRVRLGAQIVQAIVDKGFVAADGEDKYGNIILCGTKLDKADEEEKHNFLHGADGGPAVQELFFEKSPKKTGPCVMVCNTNYTPLLDAIRNLPATTIRYEKPKSDVMAAALTAKLGMKPEELQSQMDTFREMFKSQSQQIKELMQQLHGEQQAHREEMAKKDKMLQDMLMMAGGQHICQRTGCNKPTFNGKPGFCGRTCRDAAQHICQRTGCNKPTFNGKPGFCGRTCRDAAPKSAQPSAVPVALPAPSGHLCQRQGCKKPTFDGQPGFCSKKCSLAAQAAAAAPASGQLGAICQRTGCNKPTFNGKPGFCGRTCRDAAPK